MRLAHRLERTPGRIAQLTGLATPTPAGRQGRVPAGPMLILEPGRAARFALAAGLSPAEADGLCLHRYAGRYAPLRIAGGDLRRWASDVARATPWVLTGSTRYCPQCLAGDGSPIQDAHGGAWQLLWRLPVVAACTQHQRILCYYCAQCGQPANSARAAPLLPRMGDLGLHPAQCRSTARLPGRCAVEPRACGARLDREGLPGPGISPGLLGRILTQQRRLLATVGCDTAVAGPAARDLTGDLITLAVMIKLAWPVTGEDLVAAELRANVDGHVDRTRRAISGLRGSSAGPRTIWLMGRPPGDPATCAALLLAADDVLARGRHGLRDAIAPMVEHLGTCAPGALYVIRSWPVCSAGLRAALTARRGGFSLVGRTRTRPTVAGLRQLAPRHVPQFLPAPLYNRHLAALDGISARLLRRAACFKLFELAGGGTWMDAAGFFGVPITTARSTLAFARRWTTANLTRFEDAAEAIAGELEAGADLVDYQARREALARWSIPPKDWQVLILELTATTRPGQRTTYSDRTQLIASVMVWMQVTQGEHLFAPLVMGRQHEHGSTSLRAAVRGILNRQGTNYADLKAALTSYAQRISARIDSSADLRARM